MNSIRIFSLFSKFNEDLKLKYSQQKYGDVSSLNYFAVKLNGLINKNKLITENTVLFVGVKYPHSNSYKKNFVILTEMISNLNKLPIVYAFYDYKYNPKAFYDNQIVRKATIPKLSSEDTTKFKNFDFIVIEDSIITGTTLKAIQECLKDVPKSISIVSILDARQDNIIEKEINEYFLDVNDVNGLITLINSNGYVITTQMLRGLESLNTKERNYIVDCINDSPKLLESFRHYSGRDLKL